MARVRQHEDEDKPRGVRVTAHLGISCRRAMALILLAAFGLSLPSCGQFSQYIDFVRSQKKLENEFDNQPRLALLRELSPEGCFRLQGHLEFGREPTPQLLVVAISSHFGSQEVVAVRELFASLAFYALFIPEGEYTLFFFADLDRNGFYDSREMVGQTPPDNPIKVARDRTMDGFTVEGPGVTINLDRSRAADFPLQNKVTPRNYTFSSLDDEFFDPRYGEMGLYHPISLITHIQGFLFGLEEYDPRKTMVIFVHGTGGTPRDWKYIVQEIDRNRFQPWFFYYPSGLPLDNLGSLLARIIIDIDQMPGRKLDRLAIAAHSMGGLVGQAAVNRLCREGTPSYLKMYISFSTPYGGVEALKKGVERAPAVVPSWKDVAAESPFLDRMYGQRCNPEVPFYLFFGYRDPSSFKLGASSDGIITLKSQLDPRQMLSATKVFGFDATHVGILNDEGSRKAFNQILELAVQK